MTILFAILLFSFLIFIHELGHFLAAKLSGVQVNEFALFMGPAIFKKQVGDTLYSIRSIPIGGYCAMEGEDKDTENPHSFQKAAWWKRFIILVSGAGMNFVIGLLLMLIVFLPMKNVVEPVISSFDAGCTLESQTGLQVGDRILKVDGERIYDSSDFSLFVELNPGDTHDLVVLRGGEKIYLNDFEMKKAEFPDDNGGTSMRYGFRFTQKEADLPVILRYTWNSALNTVRSVRLSLQMILRGDAGLNDVTGPVGIVQMMSETASNSKDNLEAIRKLLYFGAFIAINLTVMNLLPLPALDGGRVVGLLLTVAIEAMTRKKLDPKYEGYIHGAGMILLLVLMALIMFKDIFAIFKR